ncbi:MAG: four helix bundle protein [Gemmatimonas sp.]|nr:four helix bundle protein [Gemmatimonas sp.]
MSDYRKLVVWQHAHALVLAVYKVTLVFPKDERYGLSSQVRRAAVSVAANIAEGTGRGSGPELARFCRIARGSINELEYHLLVCSDLAYLPLETHRELRQKISTVRRMLTRFIQSVTGETGNW